MIKLSTQQHFEESLTQAIELLTEDPSEISRRHPIRKLTNVAAGAGQYRLRLGRFRFRYDIDGPNRTVYRSLRREDTYR